jgi:trk system potassium uptake protein TrkA
VRDLNLPPDSTLVAIVRDRHVIAPRGDTPLAAGDEVLALASGEAEADLRRTLAGEP